MERVRWVHSLRTYNGRPRRSREVCGRRGCRCQKHGIECVVKRIDDLTRGVTARDEYEVETRNIRYELYAETTARTGAPSMLVGHHRGDVQENVICNLFKVTLGPLLSQMHALSYSLLLANADTAFANRSLVINAERSSTVEDNFNPELYFKADADIKQWIETDEA